MDRASRSLRAAMCWATIAASTCLIVAGHTASALATDIQCAPIAGTPVDHVPVPSYTPITPVRLIDTRDGTGGITQPIGAGCTLVIDLADSPVPPEAQSVSLSVTAIAQQRGFLTVYACEEGRPPTS